MTFRQLLGVVKYKLQTRLGVLLILLTLLIVALLLLLSIRNIPSEIEYGVSFSKLHAEELNLDWKETYTAILDDLEVRLFRLSAHWSMVEPERGQFDFSALDYQINELEKRGGKAIIAVGKRLPGWPECHIPYWVGEMEDEELNQEQIEYMTAVVERYKDSPVVLHWQVENEAFLGAFAEHNCRELDVEFLESEIALVRDLDPTRKIILTDSGEIGKWYEAYTRSDIFATSMYLYVWNPQLGKFTYPIRPGFFSIKQNLVEIFFGEKEMILSELSAEPWLLQSIAETDLEVQLDRMDIEKMKKMLSFARRTDFDTQLLWGAEWWYWLKEVHGMDAHWELGRKVFGVE
jgi:hypothetical protein